MMRWIAWGLVGFVLGGAARWIVPETPHTHAPSTIEVRRSPAAPPAAPPPRVHQQATERGAEHPPSDDGGEIAHIRAFLEELEEPIIPWDDAVPHYAVPSEVEAMIEDLLVDTEQLFEMHCEAYPCVALVAGLRRGSDLRARARDAVRELDADATYLSYHLESPGGPVVTALVIGGADLATESKYLEERIHNALLDGGWYSATAPVHPGDPMAAEPLWIPESP